MTGEPLAAQGETRHYGIITLFPEMFSALTECGITRRAQDRSLYQLHFGNPRDYAENIHRTVDDRPYGGGPGMVMMPGPLEQAIDEVQGRSPALTQAPLIYLSPQGRRLDHALVQELTALPALSLLCGRYEGVDQRVIARRVTMEVSLGDFVLSGGELPAMVLLDAIIRQLPGALNDADSAREDSFADGLLDCPHFTRPEEYAGARVPDVLLSGNHAHIRRWRLKQSLGATWLNRPDLFETRPLSKEECSLLEEFKQEHNSGASLFNSSNQP